jgi:pyridoxamine 5'-phosphate oxidase-like protein
MDTPHTTSVAVRSPDSHLDLLERHNYRYLQSNPRVALSIVDPDDGYRYLQLRGEIQSVERDPTGAFYNTLQQRYRGRTTEVKDRDVRVVFTIRPTAFKVRG